MKQKSKFQVRYGKANQGFRPRNAYKKAPEQNQEDGRQELTEKDDRAKHLQRRIKDKKAKDRLY